jgi:hypothetical protein
MPALIIVIDEYAELADDAPAAVRHADWIARRGQPRRRPGRSEQNRNAHRFPSTA